MAATSTYLGNNAPNTITSNTTLTSQMGAGTGSPVQSDAASKQNAAAASAARGVAATILSRLFARLWDREEAEKTRELEREFHAKIEVLRKEMEAQKVKKTKLQQMIQEFLPGHYFATYNPAADNDLNYLKQQMASSAGIATSTTTAINQLQAMSILGAAPTWAVLPTAPPHINQHTIQSQSQLDNFQTILNGIVEYGFILTTKSIDPNNHAYDDDAYAIMDYRRFDQDKINMDGVISFCLSNLTDPEPILVLIESYGMKLYQEKSDG